MEDSEREEEDETKNQSTTKRSFPKKKTSLKKSTRSLVDENLRFEIFPNGHPNFLTKSALKELQEGLAMEAEGSSFERVDHKKIKSTRAIPEPTDQYGAGKEIVTLRLRAMKSAGGKLPDLYEGDFISGVFPDCIAAGNNCEVDADNTRKDFLEATGFREFRILDIFWGFKSLVHFHNGGGGGSGSSSRPSVSDTNAFVICEVVVK